MNLHRVTRFLTVALLAMLACSGCSKSAKQERHTARGDAYLQKQQFAKAELEYLNALRLAGHPDPVILRKLATTYHEQGRALSAVGALTELLRATPNDFTAHHQLATTFLGLHDFNSARSHALIVVTNQPTNSAALLLVAETAVSSNQLTESAAVLSQAAQKAPGPGVHIAQASLNLRQGDIASAEDELKKATSLNPPSPEIDLAWAKLRLVQTNLVEAEVLLKRAADASAFTSQARLTWIDFEVARGNLTNATRLAEAITDKVPDFVPPWVRLANIAFIQNQFDECDKITKRVLGLDPRSHEALLLRARMWTAQGESKKAIDELTRLESILPNNAVVKYELAAAHARAGDRTKALASAGTALGIDPGFPPAIILKARLDLQSGNEASANAALLNLHRTRPELREPTLLLASSYVSLKRLDDAIQVYRAATTRFPQDPEIPTLLGVALTAKRDTSGARSAFEQSLQRNPNYLPASEQLINLDIRSTNFPAALSRARQIQNAVTNSAVGFLLEAQVHRASKDINAAEESLKKGLLREPDSGAALAFLVEIAVQSGNTDVALSRLDDLIQRYTNSAAAWTQKGMVLESIGEEKKAVDAYERAISNDKNQVIALNNLANLYSRSPDRLDAAVNLATRAHDNAPENPAIADTLGWILYQKRDYHAARRILDAAAESANHPEVYYHAAMSDYAVVDETRARRRFTQALETPGLPDKLREDANQRLAVLNAKPSDVAALETAVKRDEKDYLAQFKLAAAYQSAGAMDKAAVAFKAASQISPQSPQPLLALARIHSGKDDKAAIEFARNARKLAPNDPAIAATLGSLSVRSGDYATGYNLLLEAQRAGSLTNPAEQYQFATAQAAAGRIADALATLNNLVANAPAQIQQPARESVTLLSGEPAQKAALSESRLKTSQNDIFALIGSADFAFSQGDGKKAAEAYRQILSVAPNHTPAHQRLAAIYIDSLNDEKSAYSHAMKAREAAPNDPQIARVLGKIALERKNYADALRFGEEASRALQNDGEPFYLIGAAQLHLKRTNDAKAALNKASALPLKPETAAATKRLLSEIK